MYKDNTEGVKVLVFWYSCADRLGVIVRVGLSLCGRLIVVIVPVSAAIFFFLVVGLEFRFY